MAPPALVAIHHAYHTAILHAGGRDPAPSSLDPVSVTRWLVDVALLGASPHSLFQNPIEP